MNIECSRLVWTDRLTETQNTNAFISYWVPVAVGAKRPVFSTVDIFLLVSILVVSTRILLLKFLKYDLDSYFPANSLCRKTPTVQHRAASRRCFIRLSVCCQD